MVRRRARVSWKKFALVEFVALTAALFRDHQVEPVPEAGESVEAARKRTLEVAEDHGMFLLQQMRRSESGGCGGLGGDLEGWGECMHI